MPRVPDDILLTNRLIIASLLVTLWLASAPASGQAQNADGMRALPPDQTLEGKLKGAETHRYQITLRAGEFFQVRAEQEGADVVLRLLGAGGAELARMDSPNGTKGAETLTYVAAQPGGYVLEVSGLDPKAGSGGYTIRREAARDATALDRRRVEVERLFVVAGEGGAADPSDATIKRWEQALAGWRELQDSYMAEQAEQQLKRNKNVRAKALFDAASQLANRRDDASLKMSLRVFAAARQLAQETGQKKNEATALDSLAEVSRAVGDTGRALEYYGLALPLWVAVGDRDEEAETLAALGNISYDLEETQQALEYFQRALIPFKATGNRVAESATLSKIGTCYLILGEVEKAIDYSNQAIEVFRAIGDRKGEAAALNNLGEAYLGRGKRQDALDFFQRALVAARDARERLFEAHSLRNIGSAYARLEEKQNAFEPYQQALAIYQALDDKKGIAEVLDEIGFAHAGLGDKAKAVEYFLQALPLHRLAEDEGKEERTLVNLGALYHDLGDKQKALEYDLKALEINRKVDNQEGVAIQLNNIGGIYMEVGERRKARDEYYNEALKIFKALQHKQGEAWTYLLLGGVASDLRDSRKALEYYKQALALAREIKDKNREAEALQGIGGIYDDSGETRKALETDEEALRLVDETEGHQAAILNSIGMRYFDLGEKQKAIEYKTKALVAAASGPKELEAAILDSRNDYWQPSGNGRLAVFYGKQGINTYQELRHALRGMDYETQKAFLGRLSNGYNSLAVSLISVGRLAEAVQVLNLSRDQQYFDSNRDPNEPVKRLALSPREAAVAARYESAVAAVRQASGKIEDFMRRFGDESLSKQQAAQLGLLKAEHKTAADALAAFIKEAEAEFSKPAEEEDAAPPAADVAELQKTLSEVSAATGQKAAALYTVTDGNQFHLLLVTPDDIKVFGAPVKSKDFNEKVLRFQALLRSPRYDPRPLGKQLYDIILKPAEGALKQAGTRTLLWTLAGNLRYVPMAALSPDGKGYLVEQYQNVVLTRSDREGMIRAASQDWAGVGFGSSRAQQVKLLGTEYKFKQLKGVTTELHTIFRAKPDAGGILPGAVFTDAAFTRDAFFKSLEAHRPLVHIASHFLFRPGDGSRSFLLLGDGTPLSLDELKGRGRVFEGVELLTLSACNTAAQRPDADGREIDGFAELAQRLGAGAVMATLWPVSDNSTPHLMSGFYRLRQHTHGITKAEALRRAQLSLLNGTSQVEIALPPAPDAAKGASEPDVQIVSQTPGGWYDDDPRRDTGEAVYVDERDALSYRKNPAKQYAHPYYWAPFVLFGNWR